PRQYGFGMFMRAVGHDQFSPWQSFNCCAKCGIGRERRVVDLMNHFEECIGLQAMLGHQSAHGGAVALVIILLHAERFLVCGAKEFRDVVTDALVHLLPEIEMMGVERVVEIEYPGFDGSEF